MSIIFLFFLLFSCISSVSSNKDDEKVLLKLKKELGNPGILSSWVEGFKFCGVEFRTPEVNVNMECTGTGRVSSLYMLNLQDVSAPFPKAICELAKLEILYIYCMPGFHGPIPSCITKLPNLRKLIIFDTSFSGFVPNFYNHVNITDISIVRSHLSGTIPSSLSTLPNLKCLALSVNYLTGSIPPGLLHHPSSTLALSDNNFTGEIPKYYGSVDFSYLDLRNNRLNGDASFLFGKQKMTSYIFLDNNQFEFDLSYVEFSDNLYQVDLSHNKIYGKVPDSFATAARLYYPNLSFNRLCGALPQGGNMQRFYAGVFANNSCLCGNLLPPC